MTEVLSLQSLPIELQYTITEFVRGNENDLSSLRNLSFVNKTFHGIATDPYVFDWKTSEHLYDVCKQKQKKWMGCDRPRVFYYSLFIVACQEGYLELCKWVWMRIKKSHTEDSLHTLTRLFITIISYGHLNVCKWLWLLHLETSNRIAIRITANDNEAFRTAARLGYVEICQWLLMLRLKRNGGVNIDPTTCNNEALRRSIENKHSKTSKWLWSLRLEENGGYDIESDKHCDWMN